MEGESERDPYLEEGEELLGFLNPCSQGASALASSPPPLFAAPIGD